MTDTTLTTPQAIALIRAATTRHIGSDHSALSTLLKAKARGQFEWRYSSRTGRLLIDRKSFDAWLAKSVPPQGGRPRGTTKKTK